MNTKAITEAIGKIFKSDTLSEGKKMTEIGNVMKSSTGAATGGGTTRAAALNLGKYGLPAAGLGIGAGAGIGGGALLAGAGVQTAFGLDFSTEQKAAESKQKITGWVFFIVLAVVALWFLWPRIKKMVS
ncbi:hypothetical protein [Methanorbis furvi]|uniref:Uncharacterized protein n=1 Tax=Methanorbis furvi TaxID=3028299 RepID=A0AAE4MB24_9EURY|nr:hypothetical protein [Methanocorpusculaceae archaeon Ag1]MDV0442592.1 hypothetical protein [Methanocorpusculaceae archaeon Ag1]